jgi:hypothetical protein
VNYAVALAEPFRVSFSRLPFDAQEVVLDDIDGIAKRPDLASDASDALEPTVEWHRHVGEIEGARFDIVTWIAINPMTHVVTAAYLFDLLGDVQW